jgi:hypothetical protein
LVFQDEHLFYVNAIRFRIHFSIQKIGVKGDFDHPKKQQQRKLKLLGLSSDYAIQTQYYSAPKWE